MKVDVFLRELEVADAAVSYQWRNDPEVWKYTGRRPDIVVTEEIEKNWLENALARENEKRFAICTKEGGRYIGNVQLTNLNETDAEFHIFIGEKSFWGKSVGTQATLEILKYAFEVRGLNSVYLHVNKNNISAVKAYKKAGFTETVETGDDIRMVAFRPAERTKVSVFMITYNHGEFIESAVQSIVSQQSNFKFDLVVGDDFSTDNTREVLIRYARQYPDIIKLILQPRNVGAMANQRSVLNHCKGEYFAMCEGDDSWIDPLKLQKQVDFLEKHPDFAICFTNTRIDYFNNEAPSYLLNEGIQKDVFTLDDLIGEEEIWFMATASLMFRASSVFPLPEWFHESKSGDIPLAILSARHGKIKYLPDVTAMYRKHAGGVSLTDHKNDARFLLNRIFMYSNLDRETGFKFHHRLRRNIGWYYYKLLDSKQFKDDYQKKLPLAIKYIRLTMPGVPHLKEVIRDHILPPFLLNFSRIIRRSLGMISKE